MANLAVRDYAFAHARIRGRIGRMPDEAGWMKIVNAGDLETTIETMAVSGLSHWVKGYPRRPAPEEIERHCLIGLLRVSLFAKQQLPGHWKATGQWISQLPHVMQIQSLLSDSVDKKILLPGSPLLPVLSNSLEQRNAALRDGEYAAYIDDERTPESCWATRFSSRIPAVKGHERRIIARITQMLEAYTCFSADDMPPDQLWLQRKTLFQRLKRLLAGDPFHAGTVLIYALLESIQFERVRAVLLLRAYQWPASLLRGLA